MVECNFRMAEAQPPPPIGWELDLCCGPGLDQTHLGLISEKCLNGFLCRHWSFDPTELQLQSRPEVDRTSSPSPSPSAGDDQPELSDPSKHCAD